VIDPRGKQPKPRDGDSPTELTRCGVDTVVEHNLGKVSVDPVAGVVC
jgi:hypothetical protein